MHGVPFLEFAVCPTGPAASGAGPVQFFVYKQIAANNACHRKPPAELGRRLTTVPRPT